MSAILPPIRGDEPAFLGMGSNLGDPLGQLQEAVDLVDADERTTVEAVSSVYETEPVGGPPDQPPYLNIALYTRTRRSPRRLLALCAEIERRLGRVRGEPWGPRTIDVDILLYGMRTVDTATLVIPHARLTERAFALIPLIEVAPGIRLPDGASLTSALAKLAPVEGVRMIGSQVKRPARSSDRTPDQARRGPWPGPGWADP